MFGVISMTNKYIGHTVEIIYEDRHGKLSQRRIVVRSVTNGTIVAYDLSRQAIRAFRHERILAMQPVRSA
jgi:predicted DNA-binding transcriptional regulator YafY